MIKGFGVHATMWVSNWDPYSAEKAISLAAHHKIDFIEIPVSEPFLADDRQTRALLTRYGMRAVCSLGLPKHAWASVYPEAAIAYLKTVIDRAAAIGAEALSGVLYGGIGERTGLPPTQAEYDTIARVLTVSAHHAKERGLSLGIEAVNRYETHLINTARQTIDMIEKIGADNVFAHLDTYHMNIEEQGIANGILIARKHLKYLHLSESDRGIPGYGNIPWDEVFVALAAIDFEGALAIESFCSLDPESAAQLAVWRPVAESGEEVMINGLAFLKNKARKYGVISPDTENSRRTPPGPGSS